MNTSLPPDPDEALPGEADVADVYRKLPKREPGPALDAAVLQAAAQALQQHSDRTAPATSVQTAPRRGQRARAKSLHSQWLIGLSSAATLILVGGLAWHMRGMPTAETSTSKATSLTSAPERTASTQAALSAPLASTTASVEMPRAMRKSSPSPAQASEPMGMPVAESLPMNADKRLLEQNKSMGSVTADAPTTAAPAGVMEVSAPSVASAADDKPSARMVMAAPAPLPLAGKAAPSESEDHMADADRAAVVASEVAAAPAIAQSPIVPATSALASDTPAEELDKIQRLLKEHHVDEARQRLVAFRQTHPAWPLPPELQALLPKP